MERQRRQPNWQSAISRFLEYVKTDCELEIIDPGVPETHTQPKTRPFMPKDRIQTYFTKQECKELRSIISALFPNTDPINPRVILSKYTSVFCTLLSIGRGEYIEQFRHYDSLNDAALPFNPASPPAHLPEAAGDPEFLRDFCKAQWKFCAATLEDPVADKHFDSEQVLPIIFKKRLAGGGSATLWLVKIYPSYNKLISEESKNRLGGQSNTFVLKEYSTLDANQYYENETAAFNKIGTNPNIIGYYGSFRRGDTFNVILEYADQGNLKEFFQKQDPPSTGELVIQFWEGLFKLIDALRTVHNVEQFSEEGPRILQGWHQDVRPENILVVSNGSTLPYEWQFKLADLGISHFKTTSSSRENTANDTYGTRTYGAPECFRPDQVSGQAKLKVNQNIDIWSLGCIYSETIRWLPFKHKYAGIVAYCEERRAEIDKIPAFDGVDCFHNGRTVLEAVHESNETAVDGLLRKDFITEKVIEMVNDMLVPAEARPTAHWLWSKQLRILETARKKLKPPDVASPTRPINQVQGPGPQPRSSPQPRNNTHPISGPSGPPLPPVLPPGFGLEATTRPAVYQAQWDPPNLSHMQMYDNNYMVLGNEEGPRRHSPDSLTEVGDEEGTSSPLSQIPGSLTTSQHGSPIPSPPQQSPYARSNYQYRNQQNLEDIGEDQSGSPSAVFRQGSRSRPRGTSQMSGTSNPRYSAPAAGTPQSMKRSSTHEQQRQSLPNRRMQTNGIPGFDAPSNSSYGGDPFSDNYNDQRNVRNSQAFGNKYSSPVASPPDPLQEASKTNSTNHHYSPQQHRPRPVVIQNPTADYLSLQDALDWRDKCKDTNSHAPGLKSDLLNRLKDRDHVFLVDDSRSMAQHWPMVNKVFKALSYIVKEMDKDGIDLYFTISETYQKRAKKTSKLLPIVQAQMQRGNSTTDINFRLTKILDEYKNNLDKKKWYQSGPKPLSLYVLTDGLWEEDCTAIEPIKMAVQKLEDLRKDERQIGIQFISFGENPTGLKRLHYLDDGLNLPKDIVDTEPSHGNVYKMLLGGISKGFDSLDRMTRGIQPVSELAGSPGSTVPAR